MAGNLSQYISIADAISKLFNPHAEIVIHDIEDDTIFYIVNPYSGREKGGPSNLEVDAKDFNLDEDVIGPYEKFGAKGQRIRSITSVLKDDKGNPVGLMCINLDFSILESSLSVVKEFFNPMNVESHPEILFRNEWLEVIQLAICSYLKEQSQTLESLDVQTRKALLAHLDEKGLFYARKSVEQVAVHLGISRATIYKNLGEIRKKKNKATDIFAGL